MRAPSVHPEEAPRLAAQQQKMLEMLKRGPVTNGELAHIGRIYTARISELRNAGYDIQKIQHNRRTGQTLYALRRADGYFDPNVISDTVRQSAIAYAAVGPNKWWLMGENGEPILYWLHKIIVQKGKSEQVVAILRGWDAIERAARTEAQAASVTELRQAWDEHWRAFADLAGL